MQKKEFVSVFVAAVYSVLGIVIIATVANILERAAVYSVVIPISLFISGLLLFVNPTQKLVRTMSLGMLAIGTLSLLVRYTSLDGSFVYTVLGITLLGIGIATFTQLYQRISTKKPPTKE